MEDRIVTLSLFLEALEVSQNIETVQDRKKLQKAVYLGQRIGVDLGYRFGWYLMGPYSPALTQDYFQLAETSIKVERRLRSDALNKLSGLRKAFSVPKDVDLPQEDWLELLASYDYLRRVSGYTHKQAVQMLEQQKLHVVPYVNQGIQALKNLGLDYSK